jgi:predicted AlkP superfamily phosphohydrolase/phosphomutase
MERLTHRLPIGRLAAALLLALLLTPSEAQAYVGPGAGFAFLSSFLVLFSTVFIVFASLLIWPFRTLWRAMTRRTKVVPKVRRFIVVGFDGQDPQITDRLLGEGKLPNFKRLAEMGCYKPLKTTFPSISPVAWSSFSTGTHPARHNIYDFLDRDRRTYLPVLSSTRIGSVDRFLKLGPFRVPLEKPELRLLRKSKPFWSILGEHNIWSTVLRVPITFPPDRFYGAQLSAMCVPDLLGTQGTFLLYTTRPASTEFKEGGLRIEVNRHGSTIEGTVRGPENIMREGNPNLEIPLVAELDVAARKATIRFGDETVDLEVGTLSDWIELVFPAAPGIKVRGIARVAVTELDDEHFSLYMTPIALDPEKPAMPISHPDYYAVYLAKLQGKFSTLGLAEDTWALNEKVIDDEHFLKMTLDIDDERREMFWSSFKRTRKGSLVCVFDATDRIQHMYWRYMEKGHPADDGRETTCRKAIEELYVRNDELVGQLLDEIREDDMLMVLSDHGFASFRRGVNLNRWLRDNGYLHLKPGTSGNAEWLRDVDWSKTKAYCLGLSGMFFNIEGREAEGIVKPEEVDALKREIADKLRGLRDDEHDEVAIVEAFDTAQLYKGPYLENAPEFVIGYNRGYRTSWDCATGVVDAPLFEDNVKAWSGDHCVDPRLVPGVIFCNRKIDVDDPALIDIAPTALQQFGIEPPKHMDGRPLFTEGDAATATA